MVEEVNLPYVSSVWWIITKFEKNERLNVQMLWRIIWNGNDDKLGWSNGYETSE